MSALCPYSIIKGDDGLSVKVEWDVHYLTDEQIGTVRKYIADIEAENEKLRELVRDLWRFTGTACKKYPRLFDQSAQGGQMVMLNMLDSFEQRMRELGVEV